MRTQTASRLYGQAVNGLPGLGTPAEAAQRSLSLYSSPGDAADRLRSRYAVLAGATGFLCGLPGYATMPVTIPSNIAGVLLLQLHMCATIAALGGHDLEDDEVRRQALRCVLTDGAEEDDEDGTAYLLNRIGAKLGERGIRFVSERAIRWVGRTSRRLPLVGGVVGGYSDLRSTREVGQRATRMLIAGEDE